MATFTMELWEALEISGGTFEVVDGQTVITGGDIGLNHYPIFDEEHRAVLNGKIFDRYMNHEIGAETFSMFRHHMRSRMNEIMPYFNQLYESEKQKIDPLSTMNIESEQTGTATGVGENTSERSSVATAESETGSGNRSVNSTTPQVMLSGNGDYASSAADSTGTTNVESESTETGDTSETTHTTTDNESTSKTTGYQGHAPELMARYRELLINIDVLVVEALSDLFMLLWGTNDPFVDTTYQTRVFY